MLTPQSILVSEPYNLLTLQWFLMFPHQERIKNLSGPVFPQLPYVGESFSIWGLGLLPLGYPTQVDNDPTPHPPTHLPTIR